jgi:hypothetical protein
LNFLVETPFYEKDCPYSIVVSRFHFVCSNTTGRDHTAASDATAAGHGAGFAHIAADSI